MSKDGLIETGK